MNASRRSIVAGILGSSLATPSIAQNFPAHLITVVVFSPAGSITDNIARFMAERFRTILGQSVIIENKPGQEGVIAARTVAQSNPDGYTILLGGNSTHSAPPNLYRSVPYDPIADFAPIGGVVKIPLILTVRADFPADDFRTFLDLAKARNPSFTFGSGSTSTRAAGELLKARAGIDLLNVPYRGTPQAVTDLLGSRVDIVFADPATVMSTIEDGRLKALAVTGLRRISRWPAVLTIAESGFPGFEVVPWLALFAPARTPRDAVSSLQSALGRTLEDTAMQAYLTDIQVEPFPASPDQLLAFIHDDLRLWSEFVRLARIEKS